MFGSVGSGVAHPLSPPPTWCHMPRGIPVMRRCPMMRLLLGPRYVGSSCLLPSTLYGIALSTVTWYIWAFVRRCRNQVRPRLIEIERPWSCATIMRSGSVGSIHMSWWSPPGAWGRGVTSSVRPPSVETVNEAVRKYASSSSLGEITTRE